MSELVILGTRDPIPTGGISATTAGGGGGSSATSAYPLNVPVYDGNPSAGHPDVLYVANGWNGWKYWMAYTPFPTSPRENPCIVVSNDGINWTTPAGLTNPVASLATAQSMGYDYWADTELVLSPDGTTMWLYFKGTKPGVSNHYVRATSTNGTTWTAPQVVTTDAGVSPAINRETSGYSMIEVFNNLLVRRTSTDGVTWSSRAAVTQPTLPAPYNIWHVDVVKSGGLYHALISASVPTGTGPYRLFYWTSPDAQTWTGSTQPAVPLTGSRFDTRGHYRSALIPAASGAAGKFDLWLSMMDETRTNHDSSVWRIGHIRNADFATMDPNAWTFGQATQAIPTAEPDEIWAMAGEIRPYLGSPPVGPVSGWPAIGLRKTASDGVAVAFAPPPPTWHHFTFEILIVATATGDVALNSRRETMPAAGQPISLGAFNPGIVATIDTALVPKWIRMWPDASAPIQVLQGRPFKLSVERGWVSGSDTLAETVWVLAARLVRRRAHVA